MTLRRETCAPPVKHYRLLWNTIVRHSKLESHSLSHTWLNSRSNLTVVSVGEKFADSVLEWSLAHGHSCTWSLVMNDKQSPLTRWYLRGKPHSRCINAATLHRGCCTWKNSVTSIQRVNNQKGFIGRIRRQTQHGQNTVIPSDNGPSHSYFCPSTIPAQGVHAVVYIVYIYIVYIWQVTQRHMDSRHAPRTWTLTSRWSDWYLRYK